MLEKRFPVLFSRTKMMEAQFDTFMDRAIEASLIFERAFRGYLKEGYNQDFAEAVEEISDLADRNDELKKEIETRLYEQTLIPDLRGDVLSLIEGLDDLLHLYHSNCMRFSVEKPDIPNAYHRDLKSLAKSCTACVDSLIMASRAFFTNFEAVRDHSVKVHFFRAEAFKINTRLKTKVFDSDLGLAEKNHMRYFFDRVEKSAPLAENVAGNLAIYALKRST